MIPPNTYIERDLHPKRILMLPRPQCIRLPHAHSLRLSRKDLRNLIQYLMILRRDSFSPLSLRIKLWIWHIHRSHQHCPALALELHDDRGDILIAGEREDDPAADEVEIRVEGMRVVEYNSDRHCLCFLLSRVLLRSLLSLMFLRRAARSRGRGKSIGVDQDIKCRSTYVCPLSQIASELPNDRLFLRSPLPLPGARSTMYTGRYLEVQIQAPV